MRKLEGFSDGVAAVAITPDGRHVVSRSGDTVRLWDVVTGHEVRTLVRHTDGVAEGTVTPDGKLKGGSSSAFSPRPAACFNEAPLDGVVGCQVLGDLCTWANNQEDVFLSYKTLGLQSVLGDTSFGVVGAVGAINAASDEAANDLFFSISSTQ